LGGGFVGGLWGGGGGGGVGGVGWGGCNNFRRVLISEYTKRSNLCKGLLAPSISSIVFTKR